MLKHALVVLAFAHAGANACSWQTPWSTRLTPDQLIADLFDSFDGSGPWIEASSAVDGTRQLFINIDPVLVRGCRLLDHEIDTGPIIIDARVLLSGAEVARGQLASPSLRDLVELHGAIMPCDVTFTLSSSGPPRGLYLDVAETLDVLARTPGALDRADFVLELTVNHPGPDESQADASSCPIATVRLDADAESTTVICLAGLAECGRELRREEASLTFRSVLFRSESEGAIGSDYARPRP